MRTFMMMTAIVVLAVIVAAQQWLLEMRITKSLACLERQKHTVNVLEKCTATLVRCEATIDECPVLQIRGGAAWALQQAKAQKPRVKNRGRGGR